MKRARLLLGFTTLVVSVTMFSSARAAYPEKPIRLIVPYAAAGGTDTLARILANKLSDSLGQTIVVENRAGADGLIGTRHAAEAPKDGYTLLLVSSGHSVNPTVYKNIPFDTLKDFTCITQTADQQVILAVNSKLPIKNVKELIEYAKQDPKRLNFASSSKATQLYMELFNSMAGIHMTNIPYKGSGPALIDLLGGSVQTGFIAAASAMPHIEKEGLRALAIGSSRRSKLTPELPTVSEAGVPGYNAVLWSAMFAPSGTPPEIIQKLNTEINKIIADPEFQKKIEGQGFELVGGTSESCDELMKEEVHKWADTAKKAGIESN